MIKKAIALVLLTGCVTLLPLTRVSGKSLAECVTVATAVNKALEAKDWPRVLSAAEELKAECAADPKVDTIYAAVASAALRQMGRYSDALATAIQCVRRVPSADECWVEEGDALRELGRLTEARDAFRQAAQVAAPGSGADIARGRLEGVEAALARKAQAVPGVEVRRGGGIGAGVITLTGPIGEQTVADFKWALEGPIQSKKPTLLQNGNLFDAETHEYIRPAPLTAAGTTIRALHLDSRGGSVSAAMAIGEAVRKADFVTIVLPDDECSSACVLILAAGTQRRIPGRVGIHRPSPVDRSQFGSLKQEEAASAYYRMSNEVREYLRRMGFDDTLHSAMLRVPSGEVRYLTPSEVKSFGLEGDDAAYAEWQKSRGAR